MTTKKASYGFWLYYYCIFYTETTRTILHLYWSYKHTRLSKSKLRARIFVFINLIIPWWNWWNWCYLASYCSLLKSFFLFPYRTLVCLDDARTQSCSNIVASWYFLIILSLLYCTIYDRWTWLYYDQTECGWMDEWMNGWI